MPTTTINEIDNTTSTEVSYTDYTVLIPAIFPTAVTSYTEKLFTKFSDFKSEIVDKITKTETNVTSNIGYNMAYKLLELGMPVLYCKVIETTTSDEDGDTIITTNLDNDFFTKFTDKGKYNIRFITSGGYVSTAINGYMMDMAKTRGECIALIDTQSTTVDTKEILNEIKNNVINSETNTYNESGNYATTFAPWFKIEGEDIIYPASFDYLACFINSIKNGNPSYIAIANTERGMSPLGNITTLVEFGDLETNILQARNVSYGSTFVAVNPITNFDNYKNIIYGNRTLYPIGLTNSKQQVETDLIASSFLNIRNLCCDIKKKLYTICRKYTFEPNSDTLWVNFKSEITSYLDKIKSNEGISGYKIVKITDNKKATLKAKINIIPIEGLEDFDITLTLEDSIEVNEQ